MDRFSASLKREHKQGSYSYYVSINTHVSGILRRAANQTLVSFLVEYIWSEVGIESNTRWFLDNKADRIGLVFGIHCLNVMIIISVAKSSCTTIYMQDIV